MIDYVLLHNISSSIGHWSSLNAIHLKWLAYCSHKGLYFRPMCTVQLYSTLDRNYPSLHRPPTTTTFCHAVLHFLSRSLSHLFLAKPHLLHNYSRVRSGHLGEAYFNHPIQPAHFRWSKQILAHAVECHTNQIDMNNNKKKNLATKDTSSADREERGSSQASRHQVANICISVLAGC